MDAAVFCRVWTVPAQETGGNTAPDLFCGVWGAAVAKAVLSSRLCVFHSKCSGYCCWLFFLLRVVTGMFWFFGLVFCVTSGFGINFLSFENENFCRPG